jgi:8-oxo-dGTP diphosphatase
MGQADRAEERHSVAVAGVILDADHRVLLMRRRDHGNWEPPGGVLKVGESIHDGLAREVVEETGISISIRRLTGVYENPRHGVLSLVFSCRAEGAPARTTEEAAEVAWVDVSAAKRMLNQDYFQWIKDARAPIGVSVRIQHHTVKGASSSPASPL